MNVGSLMSSLTTSAADARQRRLLPPRWFLAHSMSLRSPWCLSYFPSSSLCCMPPDHPAAWQVPSMSVRSRLSPGTGTGRSSRADLARRPVRRLFDGQSSSQAGRSSPAVISTGRGVCSSSAAKVRCNRSSARPSSANSWGEAWASCAASSSVKARSTSALAARPVSVSARRSRRRSSGSGSRRTRSRRSRRSMTPVMTAGVTCRGEPARPARWRPAECR